MACGGVLDAYKTLKLIQAGLPDKPVVGSLTASSNSVTAGATVTLTAHAITDAGAAVTSVRFVLDANNNGQYDSGDTILGLDRDTHRRQRQRHAEHHRLRGGHVPLLAAAQNSKGNWSAWVATTLTVLPADVHGNNAATATTVGVPSTTAGSVSANGDMGWFKFQATAGKSYVFTVVLGTLHDSVLYLYDATGQKQLAFNDDYGGTLASQIAWTATTSGTYYLDVGGYANRNTGTYSLNVQVKGTTAAPVAGPANLAARAVENVPAAAGTAQSIRRAPTEGWSGTVPFSRPPLWRNWPTSAASGSAADPTKRPRRRLPPRSLGPTAASPSDEVFAQLATPDASPAPQETPLVTSSSRSDAVY